MTTVFQEEKTCALCGTTSTCTGLSSSSQFGSPDLDLRPPELMRSTLPYWVQHCPTCGYCAPDLSERIDHADVVTARPEYRQLLTGAAYPPLANRFLCLALLYEACHNRPAAGMSTLHAAWACDDANAPTAARACRRMAAVRLDDPDAALGDPARATALAVRVDVLRRAGAFAEAQALCRQGLARIQDATIQAVLRYQDDLIARRDVAGHTVTEALQQH